MMIRLPLVLAAGVALAACAPDIPDSGRGVGFDTQFSAEQRARDAVLAGRTTAGPSSVPISNETLPQRWPEPGSPEATAAETSRVLAATRPGGAAPVEASPLNPPPPVLNGAGISNENNFDAVSGQRSIEGDAARLASNSAQYQVIQPEALPSRTDAGPNIVAFALQTNHPRGTQVYRRSFTRDVTFQRACAPFASADQAQIEFLARGGPDKDRDGMDPDGDGFACAWDPTPYRRAAQQG